MSAATQKLVTLVFFTRKDRIDCYQTVADLLESGLSLEKALFVMISTARDQSMTLQARILERWREALLRSRFSEELADWLPATEAMIFSFYGKVDARVLFAAAARIAELRDKQLAALWRALAMPVALLLGVIAMLWAAGGYFVPVLEGVVPADRWPLTAGVFRTLSLSLFDNILVFTFAVTAFVGAGGLVMVHWAGPGRASLDRIAPFSFYRLITGSAFLFVVLEILRAGLDLNARTFEALTRHASGYGRSRIREIQNNMERGAGLGRSMVLTRHGFPDPSLIATITALETTANWEIKLARFVDRWVERSDGLMRRRAAFLNGALLLIVTVLLAGAVDALFSVFTNAGDFT